MIRCAFTFRPSIPTACGQWLYSLLARLEKPVCQATASTIRQLYRICCALRCHLVADSSSFDADLAALNVLISICGAYFGQGEEYVAFNHDHHQELNGEQQDGEEEDEEEEMFAEMEREDDVSSKKQRVGDDDAEMEVSAT